MNLITFENVKFFRGDRPVLKGIGFSVDAGERVAILGGSGEGKTTVLRLILGLLWPDSGRILIDGRDIARMKPAQLREVRLKFSIVFQEGALFDSLTVGENVAFPLREYENKSEAEIEKQVKALLHIVGMEDAVDLMPEELSGGMSRRAAIARALAACEPKMFLYDEPTSGLDPNNAEAILRLIAELSREGKGFVLVSHDVQSAFRVADRFMLLKKGRLVFDGDKKAFVESPAGEVRSFIVRPCKKEMGLGCWTEGQN